MDVGNIAGLAGVIATRAEPHKALYGKSNLYSAYLTITRDSGIKDTVLLIFPYGASHCKTEYVLEAGQQVIITGKVQTYKDYTTGHITVFVWADYIAESKTVPQQNGIHLEGEVGRAPIFRTTPRGIRITDIIVKIPSAFSEGYYSYIPAICWGKEAEAAATWKEGDTLVLEGRLQSREYLKRYEDHEETLTAYEVSASKIERA